VLLTVTTFLFFFAVLPSWGGRISSLGIEWTTPWHAIWQLYSVNDVSIGHVDHWNEPAGLHFIGAWNAVPENWFIPVLTMGGATYHRYESCGIMVTTGSMCVVLRSDGQPYRVAASSNVPMPLMSHLSPPKPFCDLAIPRWMFASVCGVYPVA